MKKALPLLAGILLLLVFMGGYVLLKDKNAREQEAPDDAETLYSYEADDISSISFTDKHGKELSFTRKEDGWVYTEDAEGCQVLDDKLTEILNQVSKLSYKDVIEDVDNPADFGLEKPEVQLTLKTPEDTVTVHIGAYNETTSCQYVMLNQDANKIYAVLASLTSIFHVDLFDLIEGENFPSIDEGTITEASYTGAEESGVISSDVWSKLVTMSFHSYVDYNCTDFSKYGLDKPWLIIEVSYTEELDSGEENSDKQQQTVTTVLELGTQYQDEETEQTCYYVRLKDSKEVHSILKEQVEALFE